jgi:hypothetical protein
MTQHGISGSFGKISSGIAERTIPGGSSMQQQIQSNLVSYDQNNMMVTAYNNMGSASRAGPTPMQDVTIEYGMMTGGLRMSNGNS